MASTPINEKSVGEPIDRVRVPYGKFVVITVGGRRVFSDVALSGFVDLPEPASEPDVVVRAIPVYDVLPQNTTVSFSWEMIIPYADATVVATITVNDLSVPVTINLVAGTPTKWPDVAIKFVSEAAGVPLDVATKNLTHFISAITIASS